MPSESAYDKNENSACPSIALGWKQCHVIYVQPTACRENMKIAVMQHGLICHNVESVLIK